MTLPTNKHFVEELAQRLCAQAGDSWSSDQGAADCWRSTASDFIREANKVERWQAAVKAAAKTAKCRKVKESNGRMMDILLRSEEA